MTVVPWSRKGTATRSAGRRRRQFLNEKRDSSGGAGENHCREDGSHKTHDGYGRRILGNEVNEEAGGGVHATRSSPRKLNWVWARSAVSFWPKLRLLSSDPACSEAKRSRLVRERQSS